MAQTLTGLSVDAASIAVGTEAVFQIDGVPADDTQFRCGLQVKFGDGTTQNLRLSKDGEFKELPIRLAHRYPTAGRYQVEVEGRGLLRGLNSVAGCSGKPQQVEVAVGAPGVEPQAGRSVAATDSQAVREEAGPPGAPVVPPAPSTAQSPATLDKLDACMKTRMVAGAGIGAAVGGVIAAFLANGNKTAETGGIGALAGGALGAAIAWQGAYKACTEKLNLATAASRQTLDYRNTAARYKWAGRETLLQIEDVGVPARVAAGQTMPADFRYALLTPNAEDSDVLVTRTFQCGSTEIPVLQEQYRQSPGTIVSTGKILIPSAQGPVGAQQCTLRMAIAAGGKRSEVARPFVITAD